MNTHALGRWRKLWTQPSAEWENLPAVARGIGDELVRYCDEEGRIPLRGLDPYRAAMRRLRAHPSERRAIERAVEQLIADGFAVVTPDALVVRNFVAAQRGLTDSGERTKTWRDRQETADVPASDHGRTGERPRNDHGRTTDVPGASQTPANSHAGHVPGTPSEKREEEKRAEAPERAREPAAAATICPTVETATATPPRAPGVALFAALSAGAGDAVRTMVSGDALVRFTALCHELGVDAPALRVLGEYLRHDRATHPDRFPWRSSRGPHTAVDLGFLTRQEGENLVEFVGKARDWHAARPSEDAVAASRAAQRAAVDAAADTSGALSREETVRRASAARAAVAALASASPGRRESGERGAA